MLELKLEFNIKNNKKYKLEVIIDNAIYAEVVKSHLLGLYYLVSWKNYSKNVNT